MDSPRFTALFAALLGDAGAAASGQVEFVLADRELVVRAQPDPTGDWVVTDLFARDLTGFRPDSRPALHRALLLINDLAGRVGDFRVGIDARDILILTGRLPLTGLAPDRYAAAFARWLDQVDLLRQTVAAIGMENFALTITAPALAGAQEIRP